MSESWDRSESVPTEFLVSAELYISTAAAAALRKPAIQRRRTDKRESSAGRTDDNKKLKEKSSWLTLQKGPTGTGHWRSATCKLSEEGERCLLNIYVDESILYQTIYIHLLSQTDIRQADSSLFFRKQCLGLYCIAGQRWTSTHTAEPVYLQFPNADACNNWFALLRSSAIPEIYGRWFSPEDGGSYRMWRQVELTVIQGRSLGNARPLEASSEASSEPDGLDFGVSCEIHLNDILCGRTTVKKGLGSPDWHENFTFSDLPPFESIVLLVWQEKKSFRPAILGSVRIPLINFGRSETVEGWFSVLQSGSIAGDVQVGEIRLKMRIDEEIVLPYSAYAGLLKTFHSRNFLDWMNDFESNLKLKTISTQLMSVAVAENDIVKQVQEIASREVDGTSTSHQTLFRGNTILTKVMELCMTWYGKAFLEASIGSVIRRICAEKVAIEVDPFRSGKSTKDVERNVDQLIYWCQEFWTQIYSVRAECPQELRRLFETVRFLVEKRYWMEDASHDFKRELPWQSVSAFCFLRFIVPAILHPHLFGLCAGLPSPAVQRSLTLIAKVIQSLANLNANFHKEEFMRGVKDFLRDSVPAMIDYILVVSTPSGDAYMSLPVSDRHDRLNIVNSLRQRASTMSVLDREAIPALPYLLDIPRHLAIITSAVIRSSRNHQEKNGRLEFKYQTLDDFCSKCFEVEEIALLRVSQLATRISLDDRRALLNRTRVHGPTISPSGRILPSSHLASTERRPAGDASRSSAAHSPSDSSASQVRTVSNGSTSSSPRLFALTSLDPIEYIPEQQGQHLPPKSISTESVPSFGIEPVSTVAPVHKTADISDDVGKRKRGLLRGILRR